MTQVAASGDDLWSRIDYPGVPVRPREAGLRNSFGSAARNHPLKKALLILLGFLAAVLIIGQLVMGQMIVASHDPHIVKAHQHSGYAAVVVSLVYITLSLLAIASEPKRHRNG